MHPFSFCNPTRIEFGPGKEGEIGVYMKEHGATKAVLVYGSNRIKNSGLFDTVARSLRENGIEYIELGGIKSNPLMGKVYAGVEAAKAFGALKAWFDKIGTPTSLGQLNIQGAVLEEVIDNAVQNAVDWGMAEVYTRRAISDIFALAQ